MDGLLNNIFATKIEFMEKWVYIILFFKNVAKYIVPTDTFDTLNDVFKGFKTKTYMWNYGFWNYMENKEKINI